jgi:hypothetical protein
VAVLVKVLQLARSVLDESDDDGEDTFSEVKPSALRSDMIGVGSGAPGGLSVSHFRRS